MLESNRELASTIGQGCEIRGAYLEQQGRQETRQRKGCRERAGGGVV